MELLSDKNIFWDRKGIHESTGTGGCGD